MKVVDPTPWGPNRVGSSAVHWEDFLCGWKEIQHKSQWNIKWRCTFLEPSCHGAAQATLLWGLQQTGLCCLPFLNQSDPKQSGSWTRNKTAYPWRWHWIELVCWKWHFHRSSQWKSVRILDGKCYQLLVLSTTRWGFHLHLLFCQSCCCKKCAEEAQASQTVEIRQLREQNPQHNL